MAFTINKILAVRQEPLGPPLSQIILESVERYILKTYNIVVKLFSVNYTEIPAKRLTAAKPNMRYFHITQAFNQRDK